MSKKECRSCLFFGQCYSARGCDYFSPVDPEPDDETVEQYIEDERRKYRREWLRYLDETVR